MASHHHAGVAASDSSQNISAVTAMANSSIPTGSTRISAFSRPRLRLRVAGSAGPHRMITTALNSASGTLIQKTPAQPKPPTSSPPRVGPSAAVTCEQMASAAKALVGRDRSRSAARRIIATPQGYWAAVPMPIMMRQTTSVAMFGANGATAEAAPTRTIPARLVRRGPSTSAMRPIAGAATAVAR